MIQSDGAPLTVRHELAESEGLLRLTFDAPPGNILDRATLALLRQLLAEHARPASVRAITFETAGRHFSYGASVAEHRPEVVGDMLREFHGLFEQLIELSKPTIAIIRGRCLGGAMELATFCHFCFAAPDTTLGQPEIRLGVIAPVASLVLPCRVGQAVADDVLLTGREIHAAEAHRLGLVRTVADDPTAAALAFFREHLAPRSGAALPFAVRAARDGFHRTLLDRITAVERLYCEDLMRTNDAVEGITAFLDKRPPRWSHA